MHRFTVSLLLALVVLLGLIANGTRTQAQDATPDPMTAMASMATNPIVGTWRWQNDPADAFPVTYATFHADGTYQEVIGRDIGLGTWRPTGERTAELTAVFQDTDPFDDALNLGTITVRQAIEINAAGDTLTAQYSADVQSPDGTSLGQYGPFTATGTRVEAGPLASSGTPVAGTPTS